MKINIIQQKNVFNTLSGKNFTEGRAKFKLRIDEIEDTFEAYVVKNNEFSYDCLLGLDAIKKFRLTQDENLKIKQMNQKEEKREESEKKENEVREEKQEISEINEMKTNLISDAETEKEFGKTSNEIKKKLEELLRDHEEAFAKDKFDVGTVKNQEARIKLINEKYMAKKPYRCSIPDQKEIDSQVEDLLKRNLIEESDSPFGAPVTLAFKKEDNKKSRFCIDFRELNKIVIPESQPFPRIDDLIVRMSNCKWFSTLDINSAFWSIRIREKDRMKTAFVTQNGHYQWKCLPFGLKTSPAIFQRILSNIIRRGGLSEFCANYIDDIIVFSKTMEEHFQHLRKLICVIQEEGFKFKLQKCQFAQNMVKYLGHIIEENGVRPAKDNLKSIREFERPKNKKNVRQLLGKINFYHKYIQNASQELEPLHNLLRKTSVFTWDDDCERSFEKIKLHLCSSPILCIYDENKPVFIYTDASGTGVGAILKQPQKDDILHPVAYFSRKLRPAEQKKKAIYLECLAVKEAIVYWQHWLIGRQFTIMSDHKPLETLRVNARTDEALGDLMYYLSQYNFKIIYTKGKDNIEADSLSRNPVLESFENEDDILKVVNFVSIEEIEHDQNQNQEEISRSKNILKKGRIIFKNIGNRQRIVISKSFGRRLTEDVHNAYGHIGTKQIIQIIRPHYYFKKMDKIVNEFYKNCAICIKNKTRTSRPIGKLSKLGPAQKPFEIMSFDTVGGFGGCRSEKKYLHILVDHFTRKAYVSTSKFQTTKEAIKLIDKVSKENQIGLLLADRYSALESNELKDYLEEKNIKLVYTSIDNPESNGLNERLNQTLVNRIRCKKNQGDTRAWTVIATESVEEYNNTPHTVTGFAPYYLMHGSSKMAVPPDLMQKSDLEIDRRKALDNSIKNFEENKKRVDAHRKEGGFTEGELVYVNNGSKLNRKKLDEIRIGPFKIVRRISNSMYEVNVKRRGKETSTFHSSKLTGAPSST